MSIDIMPDNDALSLSNVGVSNMLKLGPGSPNIPALEYWLRVCVAAT